MVCKFCAAEMLRIILENQACCAKMTDTKNEMLVVELIKYLNSISERIEHVIRSKNAFNQNNR